ncbi:MAG: YqaJ viral recombinase family protein [Bacteroidales bacterium]|nr:YqaJ viral recombinase family protein [Bacteroidales bacterium]
MRTRLQFKNREEWLEARTQGIGASEVATIVGLNPYETPYQLWRRKMGMDAPKQETFAMKAGHYMEEAVARFFADESGVKVIDSTAPDFMFIDKNKPFLRVSPDRLYWLPNMPKNDDNKGILECKTTQKQIDPDDLPKTWFCQVQMNLGVAHYEHGALAWLTAGREFGYVNIDFAPDFFEWLSGEVEKFWVDNILGKQEPDIVNVDDVLKKFARPTDGKAIEADSEIIAHILKLRDARKAIAQLEEQAKLSEDAIKLFLADAETLTQAGETLATWKSTTSARLDTKALKADMPDIYAKYAKESISRRFLLK